MSRCHRRSHHHHASHRCHRLSSPAGPEGAAGGGDRGQGQVSGRATQLVPCHALGVTRATGPLGTPSGVSPTTGGSPVPPPHPAPSSCPPKRAKPAPVAVGSVSSGGGLGVPLSAVPLPARAAVNLLPVPPRDELFVQRPQVLPAPAGSGHATLPQPSGWGGTTHGQTDGRTPQITVTLMPSTPPEGLCPQVSPRATVPSSGVGQACPSPPQAQGGFVGHGVFFGVGGSGGSWLRGC